MQLIRAALVTFCLLAQFNCTLHADCFEALIAVSTGDTTQCAATSLILERNADDFLFLSDQSVGPTGAFFNGFDLFESDPSYIASPLLSEVELDIVGPRSAASSFLMRHQGDVSFSAVENEFLNVGFETRSFVTFIPNIDGPNAENVELTIDMVGESLLLDGPAMIAASGATLGGMSVSVANREQPLFDFGIVTELDNAISDEPVVTFLDLPAETTSRRLESGKFETTLSLSELFTVPTGVAITISSETFGSPFSDGFASGDEPTSWAISSDTSVRVSASNPQVTFDVIVPLWCGDFDSDGDVDSADRTILTAGWTGASMDGEFDRSFRQGDCDADGDVDTADQNGLIQNWTGAHMAMKVDSSTAALLGPTGTMVGKQPALTIPETHSTALILLTLIAAVRRQARKK